MALKNYLLFLAIRVVNIYEKLYTDKAVRHLDYFS